MIFFPRRVKQDGRVRPCNLDFTEGISMYDRLNRQDEVSVWNITCTIRSKDLAIHITTAQDDITQRKQLPEKLFQFLNKSVALSDLLCDIQITIEDMNETV